MYLFIIIFSIFYIILLICVFYMAYATLSGAPFVPSRQIRVDKMIELANLQPNDRAIDMGSGDGRVVFTASGLCAQSDGVELNPYLYWLSKTKLKAKGKTNVLFTRKSLWDYDISSYNVVFTYLIPHRMNKLAKKIKQEMKPGARIVSHAFSFPNWQPVKKDGNIYLYVV